MCSFFSFALCYIFSFSLFSQLRFPVISTSFSRYINLKVKKTQIFLVSVFKISLDNCRNTEEIKEQKFVCDKTRLPG